MKKIISASLAVILVLVVVACTPTQSKSTFTVIFNSHGGSTVESQEVSEGGFVSEPDEPEYDGYVFMYWYTTNKDDDFSFDTPVTSSFTLNALWEQEAAPVDVEAIKAKIKADYEAVLTTLYMSDYQLNLPTRGPVHNSVITWTSTNKYISTSGIVLPLLFDDVADTDVSIEARFRLEGVTEYYNYDVELNEQQEVALSVTRTVPFVNLTDEYDVNDSQIELLFETDGHVPYVRVEDFFNLLTGFIDPELELKFEKTETTLMVQYFYYDEDEDHTYDLSVTIDSQADTLVAPDPGFYWAYVYSTATNYGRNIMYDTENPNEYYKEGIDVVYDLSQYNMDVVMYEGDVVLPYYIANQLFAGSSYYNVYYNYDGLYGIYALPGEEDEAYETIRTSTKNTESMPSDLVVHTFNFLAFAMDNFYGLQDLMEVDTYYDLLFEAKDALLTNTATRLEVAISNFLVQTIDEPHTSYGYPGYYNRAGYNGPSISNILEYGPRFRNWYMDGLIATDTAIGSKWGEASGNAWNASSNKRKLFWFLDDDKTSAVISLDSFSTSDIIESSQWEDDTLLTILKQDNHLFPKLETGSRYLYYNESSKTEFVAEVVIKGLNNTAVQDYKQALVNAGFALSDTELVYVKTEAGFTYYAASSYNSTYGVVTLSFNIQESQTATEPILVNDGKELIFADSAIYLEFQFELILKESPGLENVILDITWNTGGNVGALYRVVGFITSGSFMISSMRGDTKSESTSFVYIEGPVNYEHLNWGLLTTPTSFSAANSLATIFQENNLGPIIGLKSGGGASSITPVLLPNGTAFTMSSNNMGAYRTGSGTDEDPFVYHANELGIEPTHIVSMANIYNEVTLFDIMTDFYQ